MFDLTGRNALVTGSSEGIGLAIAKVLSDHGARLVLHGVETADELKTIASQETIRAAAGVSCDLTQRKAGARLASEAVAAVGEVDILVLNAAVQVREPLEAMDEEAVNRQLNANLSASLSLLQILAPPMRSRGWGRILGVGSIQARRPHPEMLAYAATKGGLRSLLRGIAHAAAADGVTANVLSPGVIVTRRNAEALADAAYARQVRGAIPAGSFGAPTDVAAAALLLCSDAGRYITGVDLAVDGGLHL